MKYLVDFDRALYHAQLGHRNEAFDHLEKGIAAQGDLGYIPRADPRLDPLRDDPRFSELVRRVDENR